MLKTLAQYGQSCHSGHVIIVELLTDMDSPGNSFWLSKLSFCEFLNCKIAVFTELLHYISYQVCLYLPPWTESFAEQCHYAKLS
jgi:hypothetical protein